MNTNARTVEEFNALLRTKTYEELGRMYDHLYDMREANRIASERVLVEYYTKKLYLMEREIDRRNFE